eukprot:scaffold1386_cov342-Pavlova_lutheri.AAC.24
MAISASHEGACAPAFASSSSMWTRSDSFRCLPLHPFELTPNERVNLGIDLVLLTSFWARGIDRDRQPFTT